MNDGQHHDRDHQGERRSPAMRQHQRTERQTEADAGAWRRLVEHTGRAIEGGSHQRDEQRRRSCLMAAKQQAEAGDEDQQRAIGQRATVVERGRLPAKGQLQRLRFGAATEHICCAPDTQRADREEYDDRDAGGERVTGEPAKQLDQDGASPECQGCFAGHRQSGDVRCEPVGERAVGHGPHDAETGRVIDLPRIAADDAGQDVQQAHRDQSPARQGERGGGGEAYGFHPEVRATCVVLVVLMVLTFRPYCAA